MQSSSCPSWLADTVDRSTALAARVRGDASPWRSLVQQIDQTGEGVKHLSAAELRRASLSLRHRAKCGEPLDKLLPEGFALVREAATRHVGMRHFEVQLLGGIAMHFGSIAEMETGEGKTLTATLPLYLAALCGKGAHLSTVNDYLARRDAEWMEPVYKALGMTVGVIESEMDSSARQKAYACDITYGTAKEFGFDFLRDRLIKRLQAEQGGSTLRSNDRSPAEKGEVVQRGLQFVLVDEADSILIDDARTPLIISALPSSTEEAKSHVYRWCAEVAHHFEETDHYQIEEKTKELFLSFDGRRLARTLPKPPEVVGFAVSELYDFVERAIRVERDFLSDRHYVIREGEVVIVDESTGRLAEGRKWRAGIHQAIEAKEQVEVTVDSGQAARITVQDFFRRYHRLAGMTGTARSSRRELKKIYAAAVIRVPTNREVQRENLPPKLFSRGEAKWDAIVEEVREVHATGRPVLIGTRSIHKSEALSFLLTQAGLDHQVLNARHIAEEAQIVAEAGQPDKITVATNMAGRGTDIKLNDRVRELGGLHVLATELHDSARIDRQLIGRCGRQGDPGTFRFFLALDDDVWTEAYGAAKAKRMLAADSSGEEITNKGMGAFQSAQRKIERRHFQQRRALLYQEKQYQRMQREMGQDPYLDTPR